MTVATTNNRKISITDDAVTSFPFDFQILAEGDFKVRHYPDVGSPVDLVLSTHFTLNAAPWQAGGTMTTIGTPLTAGEVVMYRDMDFDQGTDLENNRRYNAVVYEKALDNLTLLVQQLKDGLDRSVVQDINATVTGLTLPPPSEGLVMVGNADEDGWEDGPSATEISNAQGYAIAAGDAQTASEGARDTSVTAAAASVTARDKAQDWAEEVEDTEVETGQYSALHHAAKAEASAATSADIASAVAGTDTYTATLGISAYTAGKTYYLSFANTNTIAAPTINFDAKGAKTIKNLDGAALAIGAIPDEALCRYDGTDMILLNPNPVRLGYIYGLILSNDTDDNHDINITSGECAASTGETLNLASEITKQIDATWAAGDDAGGLFSGTVANNTWYHVFLIRKDSDGTIDAGFDTSVTAANIPSGYTAFRIVGSVLTDGSANIIVFSQKGDEFLFRSVDDFATTNPGTAAVLPTLSTPLGIKCLAIIDFHIFDNTASSPASHLLITSPDQADQAPSSAVFTSKIVAAGADDGSQDISKKIRTNTTSQIRYRLDASNADISVRCTTHGFVHPRGQY